MKWKNAVRDNLPSTSKKVLLSLKGVYYTAFYNSEEEVFFVQDDEGDFELSANYDQIYWTDYSTQNIVYEKKKKL